MKTLTSYLCINGHGDMKLRKADPVRSGALNYDEVYFKIRVTIPETWGKQAGTIDLNIPEGAVEVEAGEWQKAPPH